jgi:hypothetical protein
MYRFLYLLGILTMHNSCSDSACDQEASKRRTEPLVILFEEGFSNDHVRVSLNDSIFLDSTLNTNASSGLASEFIGLTPDPSSKNILQVSLNGKEYNYFLDDYRCHKRVVFRNKKGKIQADPTNREVEYH